MTASERTMVITLRKRLKLAQFLEYNYISNCTSNEFAACNCQLRESSKLKIYTKHM